MYESILQGNLATNPGYFTSLAYSFRYYSGMNPIQANLNQKKNETGHHFAPPYSVKYYDRAKSHLVGLTLGLNTNNSFTIETVCELEFGYAWMVDINSTTSSSR